NTIPPATFNAFRQHGRVRASLTEGVEQARGVMQSLAKLGISIKEVTDKLLDDGIRLFCEPFDKLLEAVEKQRKLGCRAAIDCLSYKLPEQLESQVKASLKQWRDEGKVKALWSRDASLWTGQDESSWLDWLSITEDQLANVDRFANLARQVKERGFTHALLLGMGGSSLCPEVMRMTFGKAEGYPDLNVLDSTDPAQVRTRERQIDIAKTLFIVSSKSGTTLEPNIFKQYFFERARQVVGPDRAGDHFIAITDPGSKLQQEAARDRFWQSFFGVPGIGGRYSALSNFGMVPSAVMGVDVPRFLDSAHEMVEDCAATVPVEENPGVVLGTIMGVAARAGRDKVTLVTSPGIWDLGAWLEQLLAESTGKEEKGLIPVDREQLGPPEVYGNDRLFVYLRLEGSPDPRQDEGIEALEKAGQPVVRIRVLDIYQLGQEFFRWEMATAVAGAVIGINPFNQPDVEASKIATRELTAEYQRTGKLPHETPLFEQDGIKLFTDDRNAADLNKSVGKDRTLARYLRAHADRIKPGDYFALLAYIEMNEQHETELQVMRHCLRDIKKVATCLGFGPRFLHSTGQAYKGGPNSGVFLQITCDDAEDLPVPGQKYSFGVVKAAQARGDFQVLSERGRRALRVHLPADLKTGLAKLRAALLEALA
ncbi:MAG TPA: bifunctional transaldolase/phosoglucose isomerase, partial [Candidatus Obscuribacterales bacterium]